MDVEIAQGLCQGHPRLHLARLPRLHRTNRPYLDLPLLLRHQHLVLSASRISRIMLSSLRNNRNSNPIHLGHLALPPLQQLLLRHSVHQLVRLLHPRPRHPHSEVVQWEVLAISLDPLALPRLAITRRANSSSSNRQVPPVHLAPLPLHQVALNQLRNPICLDHLGRLKISRTLSSHPRPPTYSGNQQHLRLAHLQLPLALFLGHLTYSEVRLLHNPQYHRMQQQHNLPQTCSHRRVLLLPLKSAGQQTCLPSKPS